MTRPEISVCIPVYNAESFVGQAIESALSQTWTDFELIVLDNKSTDNTLKVIRKYKDKRLRVIAHKSNLGAEANWNAAVNEAKGRFVKLLCADDYIYPDCLAKQHAVLVRAKHAALVCAARDIVDESGKKIMRRGPSKEEFLQGRAAVRRAIRGGTNIFGETSSALFRAEARKAAGPFDASIPYVIDLDMWSRILLHGDVILMPDVVSAYRVGSSSWSAEIMDKQRDNFMRFIDKTRSNPAYELTAADVFVGRMRAILQAALRLIFYRVILGWRST